ncbi:helix-turn-helix domain-containing protein [Streptomyces mobaraensis]|nr:helix-turn-helix transcriptional regulator [Streptomyces mobaraensis]
MRADHAPPSRAQKFANVVAKAASRAGYTGHGWKARLARDSGLPETTVSTMLAGKRIPDPRSFEALAKALQIPVSELLVSAEIVSASTLHKIGTTPVRSQPITIDQAADELGITDPLDRQMFAGVVERLRRQGQDHATPGNSDGGEGGAAVER